MMPFLTLDEDRQRLSALRQKQEENAAEKREKGELEQAITQKTSLENRFLRKLRNARFQVFPKTENDPLNAFIAAIEAAVEDGTEDETDDENELGANEENTAGESE